MDIDKSNLLLEIKTVDDLIPDAEEKEIEEELQKELDKTPQEEEEVEDVFKRKVKKPKRALSEKQKAHLKRMREKKAEKKRVKDLEKKVKKNEEQNARVEDIKKATGTRINTREDLIPTVAPKVDSGSDMDKFFSNMNRFIGLYERMNTPKKNTYIAPHRAPVPAIPPPQTSRKPSKPKTELHGYDDFF